MMDELDALLDGYARWLRNKSALRPVNDEYVEITTPYLDRHNDYTQIYVRRRNGGYLLTDGGETIDDLRSSGCDVDTPKRASLLTRSLNAFGVRRVDDALVVEASSNDFALRKHNLIQAVLAVDDLFYLAQPMVASLFLEDVGVWLRDSDIRFSENVKLTGTSGYDHTFHFLIPSSRRAPERLVRAVNRPSREMAESLAFAWIDLRNVRPSDAKMYAIFNDERELSPSMIGAVRNYGITPVPWSERAEFLDELAA